MEADASFVDTLVNNPGELASCDEGIIVPSGTSFVVREVRGTSSGEFLYELGLRDGDVIVGVNGLPLTSFEKAAEAFGSSYLSGETNYRLEVLRGGVSVTLSIELV